jgi:hypothetical protein
LKTLLSILVIIFFATSCSNAADPTIHADNKFDTLSLPIDSGTFYFKTKTNWKDTTRDAVDTFLNRWYSHMLFALKEPVLKDFAGDKEIYRFTWLRTFNHPAVIRLEKQRNIVGCFLKLQMELVGMNQEKSFLTLP